MKRIEPRLTPKQKQILKYSGVPAFYLFCLLVFVRLTFPYDTLRSRLLAEFNGSQPAKRLFIKDMSGAGLFGIEAEGVRLTEVRRDPGEEGGSPIILLLDALEIGVGPLSYLFGSLDVDFYAEMGGGSLEGDFQQSETEAKIQAESEEVAVSSVNVLGQAIGLPLGGTLNGQIELFLPDRQMNKAEGKFDLTIQGLTVGDGKAKIRNTIALPKLNAGNMVFQAEATQGILKVSDFSADGPDFEMNADGKVRLREPFDRSALDLKVAFRFKESYMTKNEMTKSLFGSPDSKVPALFDMDPNVRRAKGEDGFYRWRVTGLLARPNFRPDRRGGARKNP